jgi:hypothetical protein
MSWHGWPRRAARPGPDRRKRRPDAYWNDPCLGPVRQADPDLFADRLEMQAPFQAEALAL